MLSWSEDADPFARGFHLTKSGSLARPGNLADAHAGSFSRKSMDMPTPPSRGKSTDSHASPAGSFSTATSLLHAHSNVAKGSLGSEGWWHHMDHGKMNETALHGPRASSSTTTTAADYADIKGPVAITPQFANPRRPLWNDEAPVTAAAALPEAETEVPSPPLSAEDLVPPSPATPTPPAAALPAAPAADLPSCPEPATPASSAAPATTPPSPADTDTPATPASPPLAAAAAAASPCEGSGDLVTAASTLKTTPSSGWWCPNEIGALNTPVEASTPLNRAVGGSVTPEFGLTGGNHYMSMSDESAKTPQPQPGGADEPATPADSPLPASPATATHDDDAPAAPAADVPSCPEPATPASSAAPSTTHPSPADTDTPATPASPPLAAAAAASPGGEMRRNGRVMLPLRRLREEDEET